MVSKPRHQLIVLVKACYPDNLPDLWVHLDILYHYAVGYEVDGPGEILCFIPMSRC